MFLYWSEGLSKHADSFTKILSLIPTSDRSFLVGALARADDICEANMLRYFNRGILEILAFFNIELNFDTDFHIVQAVRCIL